MEGGGRAIAGGDEQQDGHERVLQGALLPLPQLIASLNIHPHSQTLGNAKVRGKSGKGSAKTWE